MSLPYSEARAGDAALRQMEKMLQEFGASNFGHFKKWDEGLLLVQFTWRTRQITIEVNYRGYAQKWLQENPWNRRRNSTEQQWRAKALEKGEKAAPSIVRDWVKGQLTAIECGMMPFDHAFMPHMMLPDGRTAIQHIKEQLPALEDNSGESDE